MHVHLDKQPPVSGGIKRQTQSRLTFSRRWLIQVAYDNINIAHSGKYINNCDQVVNVQDSLKNAMHNSVHYHWSHLFNAPELENGQDIYETKFHICYMSSIEAALKLKDGGSVSVGVLNSSSAKTPGGRLFRGTVSQEDCICRATLLYPCLAQFEGRPDHYYQINNSQDYSGSSSSCAIFSPDVPIIRRDCVEANLLDEYKECSIVSIPAPNAFVLGRGNADNESNDDSMSLEETMRDRIFRALCIFAEYKCEALVLCAYGCGIHGNNPSMVASVFRNILSNELKGRFQTVVFAINKARPANYDAFASQFTEASLS